MNRALMENGEIDTKELIGQTLERKEMQQEAIELLERYGLGKIRYSQKMRILGRNFTSRH